MNNKMDFPDLSKPIGEQQEYPDFSRPLNMEEKKGAFVENLPWFARKALEFGVYGNKPLSKAIPERIGAAAEGLKRIGQGAKQLGLEAGETLGLGPEGNATEYTKKTDLARQAYEQSAAGQDPINKLITSQVEELPYVAAMGPAFGKGLPLLKRMLRGAVGGGISGGGSYVPGGEDRLMQTAQGTAMGAFIPAALNLPEIGQAVKSKYGSIFKNVKKMEEAAARAEAEKVAAEAEAERAKGHAMFETGQGTEAGAQLAAQRKRAELAGLPEQQPSNLPVQSSRESGANLQRAQAAHTASQEELNQADQAIRQHLNEGASHDVRAAHDIENVLSQEKAHIQNQFNQVENSLSSQKINLGKPQEAREIIKELRKYLEKVKPEEGTLEVDPLRDLFSYSERGQIPAVDFLKALRSVRGYANDARRIAFTHGVNQADRDVAMAKYRHLDAISDRMANILESSIPEKDSALLNEANKNWRNRVVPLYSNRTYNMLRTRERMPANIMNALRGTKDPGDQIIKEVIRNNPQILKNVVGQRFAANPEKLHNPGELASEYIAQMPELRNMIDRHANAQRSAQRAAEMVQQAEQNHANILKRESDAFRTAEKEAAKSQEISAQKKRLQSEIEKLDKHIAILKKASERKNVSLKEHMRIINELEIAKKARKKAVLSVLKYGGSAVIGGTLGYSALKNTANEFPGD